MSWCVSLQTSRPPNCGAADERRERTETATPDRMTSVDAYGPSSQPLTFLDPELDGSLDMGGVGADTQVLYSVEIGQQR